MWWCYNKEAGEPEDKSTKSGGQFPCIGFESEFQRTVENILRWILKLGNRVSYSGALKYSLLPNCFVFNIWAMMMAIRYS